MSNILPTDYRLVRREHEDTVLYSIHEVYKEKNEGGPLQLAPNPITLIDISPDHLYNTLKNIVQCFSKPIIYSEECFEADNFYKEESALTIKEIVDDMFTSSMESVDNVDTICQLISTILILICQNTYDLVEEGKVTKKQRESILIQTILHIVKNTLKHRLFNENL